MTLDSILLQTGLEVSAKFKGAFCEARIKSVDPNVKCKVRFSDGKTIETSHKNLTGSIFAHGAKVYFNGRMGNIIRLKEKDVSVYTVVFDDGDEKTLKRGSLCIKGQRHFDESVTLDSLPLTDPEHFGSNVQVNKDQLFASNIFTTDDTTTDNEDETDQSGSSVEIKAPVVEKVKTPPPRQPTPPTPPAPQTPAVAPSTPQQSETEIMEALQKEYALDQAELNQLDGPEERINMIGFHLIFLSNKYQELKSELHQIDRIRKKRKAEQSGTSATAPPPPKELKIG